MVVTSEQTEFNSGGCRLRFKHSFFLLQLEDMVSEYFGEERIGSGLFACSFGAVHDYVLGKMGDTGKSSVSASCRRTSVMSGW